VGLRYRRKRKNFAKKRKKESQKTEGYGLANEESLLEFCIYFLRFFAQFLRFLRYL
jgi:hypothetical protein